MYSPILTLSQVFVVPIMSLIHGIINMVFGYKDTSAKVGEIKYIPFSSLLTSFFTLVLIKSFDVSTYIMYTTNILHCSISVL